MNAENRYPVTASLFMLREIKHRQERVNRGYQLLKRKAEALRIKGRQAAAELAATQGVLGHTLREAYISLAAVKFTNGESNAMVLENIGEAQVRVQRISENISGVSTVSLQAIEDPTASDSLRYAGLGAGGHRTSEAKRAFREAVRILIKFASLRNTCILLDEAIKSTLRKVNGIEKVIMPKLHNTETYILMEMDEREREEFHRLKMVKAKKVRTQALTTCRQEMSALATIDEGAISDSQPFDDPFKQSIECLTAYLNPCHTALSSSRTESSGDYKPACLPHNWDDDDLLF
ncbi:V-type proton ATPase subunit D-like [Pectinophora gossypiella]|uniref:V-type proton ATPase subunit D-like n=1 Tax=Pectinophora gossypiella TaxID=13191 RepID=UPI00214E69E3|nr:V-type proton ATPase subunit D-like [Pectinophora gossypiella]